MFAFNLTTITFFCLPVILFTQKLQIKILTIIIFTLLFFGNYLYGNYELNRNKIENLTKLQENKYLNVKIVSPNFELKYNLSDTETNERINKLIKYSNIDRDKKTLFIWPEGALSGKYFFEMENYKNIMKENFSSNHLIALGINTLDNKNENFYNSFIIVDRNLNKKFQYNKIKLVPFGEFLPFEYMLKKIGFKKITEGYGSFSKGNVSNTFFTKT